MTLPVHSCMTDVPINQVIGLWTNSNRMTSKALLIQVNNRSLLKVYLSSQYFFHILILYRTFEILKRYQISVKLWL